MEKEKKGGRWPRRCLPQASRVHSPPSILLSTAAASVTSCSTAGCRRHRFDVLEPRLPEHLSTCNERAPLCNDNHLAALVPASCDGTAATGCAERASPVHDVGECPTQAARGRRSGFAPASTCCLASRDDLPIRLDAYPGGKPRASSPAPGAGAAPLGAWPRLLRAASLPAIRSAPARRRTARSRSGR